MVDEKVARKIKFLNDLEKSAIERLEHNKDECYCQNIVFVDYEKAKTIISDVFAELVKIM